MVESRSWTKSGSVGTSNESRSALPAQLRNGPRERLQLGDGVVEDLRRVDVNRRRLRRRLVDPQQLLAELARRGTAGVPLDRRRERRIVSVRLRRLLVAEPRLRPDLGPRDLVGVRMRVALRGLRQAPTEADLAPDDGAGAEVEPFFFGGMRQ